MEKYESQKKYEEKNKKITSRRKCFNVWKAKVLKGAKKNGKKKRIIINGR